jgi:probable rRNA maturation factor
MIQVVVRQRRVLLSPARLARTADRALTAVGRAGADVEVLMVDDAQMRRLNRIWRGSGRRTDVLAFPLEIPEARGRLLGQVVVSAETAARQARELGVPVAIELDLLVTHGILHLAGYDDHNPKKARLMHEREQAILSAGRRRPIPARLWQGLLP